MKSERVGERRGLLAYRLGHAARQVGRAGGPTPARESAAQALGAHLWRR